MSATAPVAANPRGVVDRVPKQCFVDGDWISPHSDKEFGVEDPATGAELCGVADATPEEGLRALGAAAGFQRRWADTPAWDRGALLRSVHDALLSRADEFAAVISLESGKALAEAHAEVGYAADFLRWYAETAGQVAGRYMDAPQGGSRIITARHPVGPCLLITPWNFPLAMATRKIAPALAAGCTVILKPAQQTPLTSLALARLFEEQEAPPGLLHVLTTTEAGAVAEVLIGDPRLRKVSFTGSTAVGRRLLSICSDRVLRTSMELGGDAPLIVFADADLERAVEGTVLAKLRNVGQSCVAANRIYVQREIADDFLERLIERFRRVEPGPALEGAELGPLIDARARTRIEELIEDATARGARLQAGGSRCDGPGYFFPPTVMTDIPDAAEMIRGEIFGPVAPVAIFDDEAEVLRAADSTAMGLAAYVFTTDLDRAVRLTDRLDAGIVGVNRGLVSNAAAPFGGVKSSGLGREGGSEGIDEYLETRYIALDREVDR